VAYWSYLSNNLWLSILNIISGSSSGVAWPLVKLQWQTSCGFVTILMTDWPAISHYFYLLCETLRSDQWYSDSEVTHSFVLLHYIIDSVGWLIYCVMKLSVDLSSFCPGGCHSWYMMIQWHCSIHSTLVVRVSVWSENSLLQPDHLFITILCGVAIVWLRSCEEKMLFCEEAQCVWPSVISYAAYLSDLLRTCYSGREVTDVAATLQIKYYYLTGCCPKFIIDLMAWRRWQP